MAFQSGFEHIVREGELLAPYTSLRLGGPAQYFAEPTTPDELIELVRRAHEFELPVRLLGGGSNLLVSDNGVEGVVIHLSAAPFCAVSVDDQIVKAGGGAKLAHVISTAVGEGLSGLESLVGIPGTIGGALHGNAGGHGGDIGQNCIEASVLTRSGDVFTRSGDDLRFAYRESSLDELVILDAKFKLEKEDQQAVTKRMQTVWIVGKAAQPMSSEPSVMLFKDSGGVSAAELIEQAGLRNASVGEVEVSDRNANYAIAGSDASAAEVLELIDQLRGGVAGRLGVELELSVEIW